MPDLAACLTLSKNDFIRSGPRGASYLAYRKAIQEVVSRQLAAWGDPEDADPRPRVVRLERDLERVLEDLADDFPLLRSLVDRRPGGQKRLPMPGRGSEKVPGSLFATASTGADEAETERAFSPEAVGPPDPHGAAAPKPEAASPPEESPTADRPRPEADLRETGGGHPEAASVASAGAPESVAGGRRPARYGLLVEFESRPGDPELGRLVDSTIWINDVHPAFARATVSRSLGYHTALAVALALAPLAVEAPGEHAFITQFLAHWGGAQTSARTVRRRRRKRDT